jgi:hypothetical protein
MAIAIATLFFGVDLPELQQCMPDHPGPDDERRRPRGPQLALVVVTAVAAPRDGP